MITLQHTLSTLEACNGDVEKLKKVISSVLLPDAIRKYSKYRQTSHFEQNATGDKYSYMKFPTDTKNLTAETIGNVESVLQEDAAQGCMGEVTSIEVFENTNGHLPVDMYYGVRAHLNQDVVFDKWIRQELNLVDYDAPEEVQRFQIEAMREISGDNAKALRGRIADIEAQGFELLAKRVYDSYGITCNQEWFDSVVRDTLKENYSQDLADGTYGYMAISKEMNDRITSHEFEMPTLVSLDEYNELYDLSRDLSAKDIAMVELSEKIKSSPDAIMQVHGHEMAMLNELSRNKDFLQHLDMKTLNTIGNMYGKEEIISRNLQEIAEARTGVEQKTGSKEEFTTRKLARDGICMFQINEIEVNESREMEAKQRAFEEKEKEKFEPDMEEI